MGNCNSPPVNPQQINYQRHGGKQVGTFEISDGRCVFAWWQLDMLGWLVMGLLSISVGGHFFNPSNLLTVWEVAAGAIYLGLIVWEYLCIVLDMFATKVEHRKFAEYCSCGVNGYVPNFYFGYNHARGIVELVVGITGAIVFWGGNATNDIHLFGNNDSTVFYVGEIFVFMILIWIGIRALLTLIYDCCVCGKPGAHIGDLMAHGLRDDPAADKPFPVKIF